MFRSLHFAALKVIFLAGAALAATRVARQDPSPPASSPLLLLPSLEQVTACNPVNIRWVYDGPNDPLTLIVTNGDVDQVAPPPSPSSSTSANTLTDNNDNTIARRAVPTGVSVIVHPIATLLPQDLSYNWTQVNVLQGWYKLLAIMPTLNYDTTSSDFYVSELGDTTCLLTTSSSSSPPSSSPTLTGSSPLPTSPSPFPSPSQSPSQTPTPVFAASSSVNKGAIAGGVVGGVVLIAIFLIVYLCLLRSKRRTHQAHPPRSRGLHSIGGWGGLASVDSHLDPAGRNSKPKPKPKPYASIRHQSQTDSLGPIIPGPGAASEENIQAYRAGGTFSPSEEKVALGEVGVGALSYSQSPRSGVLGRTYSASSIGSTNEFAMGRRPSIGSTTALPPGARRRSVEYPPPAVSQIDRAPSGASSQQQAQRKTPRKPVPAYAAGSSSSPSSSNPSPIATTPLSASPFDDDRVQRRVSNGSTGHYTTRARDRDGSRDRGGKDGKERSRTRDVEDGPVLSHKSSFGPGGVEGKPLHYLIPDMPPPPVA